MSAFNAWIFLKGLETLKLRMRAHCDNAQKIAEFLQGHGRVERVYYPGLTSHPQHELAATQQSGYGGIVSFVVKGGQAAAWKTIDATRVYSITANLGDTKSTLTKLTDEQKAQTGIVPGLIRISVGLEDVGDLIDDLGQALAESG